MEASGTSDGSTQPAPEIAPLDLEPPLASRAFSSRAGAVRESSRGNRQCESIEPSGVTSPTFRSTQMFIYEPPDCSSRAYDARLTNRTGYQR